MLINELLTLMDREVDLLTADNNHSAAALMAAGAARIRILARAIDDKARAEIDRR